MTYNMFWWDSKPCSVQFNSVGCCTFGYWYQFNCLERFVSKMTQCVPSGTLNCGLVSLYVY